MPVRHNVCTPAGLALVGLALAAFLASPATLAARGSHARQQQPSPQTLAAQAAEVRATESAFARTMAERDFAAFGRFVAADAVFIDEPALRGVKAVLAGWKPLFEGPKAAFSWEPGTVEVLGSGGLALSYGPVYNAGGERTSTFYSVWRRERDGRWRIVFDHGCQSCRCATPTATAEPAAPAR